MNFNQVVIWFSLIFGVTVADIGVNDPGMNKASSDPTIVIPGEAPRGPSIEPLRCEPYPECVTGPGGQR